MIWPNWLIGGGRQEDSSDSRVFDPRIEQIVRQIRGGRCVFLFKDSKLGFYLKALSDVMSTVLITQCSESQQCRHEVGRKKRER